MLVHTLNVVVMEGLLLVYKHFLHIRIHVNVDVTERYSFVYLRYHYISTQVKRCCHGWIFVRLLTFYTNT